MTVDDRPTPDLIVRTAIGYMASKQLFAASRVGLFTALSSGPLTAGELATSTGISERNAHILADAMASLGLLHRDDGRYRLTEDSAAYLGAGSELDLTPFLHFLATLSFPHWTEYYDRTVDTNTPGDFELDTARWDEFIAGVMTFNALHAQMLARMFDFTPYRRLLDFGGISPAFTAAALRQNQQLQATVIIDPTEDDVSTWFDEAGLTQRVTVRQDPTPTTVPEGSFDLVMLAHVIHRFDAEQNQAIFSNVRGAAAPGATLLVLDFFLDDDEHQRELDALHAGEYFVIDGTVVYPRRQVDGWLAAAGWEPIDTLALPGSPRVIVARAV